MEDDRRKQKRNKKKKNKQNKSTEEGAAADQIRESNGQNGHGHVSEIAAASNGALHTNDDVDLDSHGLPNEPEHNSVSQFNLAEVEKQQWLQREAALEERIKQLQVENDSYVQKKDILEETIKQLQNENNSQVQKEAVLEATIKQLRNANGSCAQKEAIFEETIKQLESANDLHIQNKANLEMEILQFRSDKNSWLQKEMDLEEKIKQLESDNDSWILTERNNKETIAKMNVDITRLRMQVVELEESRNSLLKENLQLKESISSLQLQIQNFETSISSADNADELRKSEHEELNSQIEAACTLVDKLIMENAELVEKVNELNIKLDRQTAAAGLSVATGSGFIAENGEIANVANHIYESSEDVSTMSHKLESSETEPPGAVPYSLEAESGEIVQNPLNDKEVGDLEIQEAIGSNEKDAVPLSDAPLIGAPFRLISFVAKYVSGADLVNN